MSLMGISFAYKAYALSASCVPALSFSLYMCLENQQGLNISPPETVSPKAIYVIKFN